MRTLRTPQRVSAGQTPNAVSCPPHRLVGEGWPAELDEGPHDHASSTVQGRPESRPGRLDAGRRTGAPRAHATGRTSMSNRRRRETLDCAKCGCSPRTPTARPRSPTRSAGAARTATPSCRRRPATATVWWKSTRATTTPALGSPGPRGPMVMRRQASRDDLGTRGRGIGISEPLRPAETSPRPSLSPTHRVPGRECR